MNQNACCNKESINTKVLFNFKGRFVFLVTVTLSKPLQIKTSWGFWQTDNVFRHPLCFNCRTAASAIARGARKNRRQVLSCLEHHLLYPATMSTMLLASRQSFDASRWLKNLEMTFDSVCRTLFFPTEIKKMEEFEMLNQYLIQWFSIFSKPQSMRVE